MFVTIGSKKYEAVDGMWAINQEITTGNAASKAVWVFDKSYTGNFNTNGYDVAVVLDEYGRVIRVYDGANGGYWLPSGKQASAHFTVNTYATVAWSELQEGETLVVFPSGVDSNKARQIGLDCRYLFNQKMNITGFTFADPNKTITIGSKTYTHAFFFHLVIYLHCSFYTNITDIIIIRTIRRTISTFSIFWVNYQINLFICHTSIIIISAK
jgi:hypothetical protein